MHNCIFFTKITNNIIHLQLHKCSFFQLTFINKQKKTVANPLQKVLSLMSHVSSLIPIFISNNSEYAKNREHRKAV